jgi:pimeloyl-ACP methyl ester carboxylesterase
MNDVPREPVVIIGGFLSDTNDYLNWKIRLEKPPFNRPTFITRINRNLWLQNRRDDFTGQILALQQAVQKALRVTGAEKVWLVSHSAGGRIARLWMGDQPYNQMLTKGHEKVRGLISLGVPYTSQEPWARTSTVFVNSKYPGAFYPDVKYLSVIGKAVYGRQIGLPDEMLAWQSYGLLEPKNPAQWGDGIISLASAYLPGAENIILKGIYHASVLGRPSYIAEGAVSVWGKYLRST